TVSAANAAVQTANHGGTDAAAQSGTSVSQVALRREAVSAPPDPTVRVEGNVIQFPKCASSESGDDARPSRITLPAGTSSRSGASDRETDVPSAEPEPVAASQSEAAVAESPGA